MDINLFRTTPDVVRESQRRRGKSVEVVDQVIELDEQWKKINHELNVASREFNANSKLFGQKKQAKEDTTELAQLTKELKIQIAELREKQSDAEKARNDLLFSLGNIVHQSVPVSDDEENNELVRTWGKPREHTAALDHHHQLLYRIGGYEPEAGTRVAGHRGYFLTEWGMILNNALIQFGINFLGKNKYKPVQVPFFMKKSAMEKVAALAEFDEALYKVTTGNDADEALYLIATSEQPMCCLHQNDIINPKDCPIKYAGLSTCFRKEAGKSGKEAWGTFRVHQFEKVEQFVLCSPETSWEVMEDMIQVSEEFYQALNLPYRIVTIVSGELNNAAAKKYDLEAWFPTLAVYRELVSCSNCTDYQSRRMEIKFGSSKTADGQNVYVHMLNSTLCATERTLCCVLENYQTENGVRVPEALKPYIPSYLLDDLKDDVIPFVRDALKTKGGKHEKTKK